MLIIQIELARSIGITKFVTITGFEHKGKRKGFFLPSITKDIFICEDTIEKINLSESKDEICVIYSNGFRVQNK